MEIEWIPFLATAGWFLFFFVFSEVITLVCDYYLGRYTRYYKFLGNRDRHFFNNHVTSLLHSSLCSIGVFYACYIHHLQNKEKQILSEPVEDNPSTVPIFFSIDSFSYIRNNLVTQTIYDFTMSFVYEDPIYDSLPGYYYFFPISVGYFIYDFFALYIWHRLLPWNSVELIAHHAVCIIGGFISIQYKQCQPYLFIGLIAEVNTVFLHTRKLMKFLKWDKDRSFFKKWHKSPSSLAEAVESDFIPNPAVTAIQDMSALEEETPNSEKFRLWIWNFNWFIMFNTFLMYRIIGHTYGTISVIMNFNRFTIFVLPFAIFCCVMINIFNYGLLFTLMKLDFPEVLKLFGVKIRKLPDTVDEYDRNVKIENIQTE